MRFEYTKIIGNAFYIHNTLQGFHLNQLFQNYFNFEKFSVNL